MSTLFRNAVQMLRYLRIRLTRFGLRCRGIDLAWPIKLDRDVDISRGIGATSTPGSIAISRNCQLSQGVVIHAFGGRVQLAENVFLGPYSVIYGHGGVTIGDNTLVSMHCRILSSNHTIAPAGVDIRAQPDIRLPTKIGRDVWLGAGVTVLGGVTIADGCVVGAGAVVTRDLPENAIAYGVPAKVVGSRAKKDSTTITP